MLPEHFSEWFLLNKKRELLLPVIAGSNPTQA